MKPAKLLLATLMMASAGAMAEKADRDKPLMLDAGLLTVDDVRKVRTFSGNVRIQQGSLVILCEKLVVSENADGITSGVATDGPGGLAHFRQKRDGRDEYVEGEAERIVYDGKAEKTEFFKRARIKSGQDEVSGQYISYDARTENYTVSSGSSGNAAAAGPGNRVRAVIQPKKDAVPPSPNKSAGESTPLKPAPQIITPVQE